MVSKVLPRAIILLTMVSSGLFPAYPQHQNDACVAILAHFLEFPWFETFIIDNFHNSFSLKLHFATDGTCLRVHPNRSLRIIIAILRTERRLKWAAGSQAGASFYGSSSAVQRVRWGVAVVALWDICSVIYLPKSLLGSCRHVLYWRWSWGSECQKLRITSKQQQIKLEATRYSSITHARKRPDSSIICERIGHIVDSER